MSEVLPPHALVLDGLDCLHLAGALGAYLRDVGRRDGGVPPRLAVITADAQVIAARYRASLSAGSDVGTFEFRDEASGGSCATSASWLTVEQTAQLLGCSPEYVRRLCRQRALYSVRAADRGAWRVDEAAVLERLDARRERQAA